VASRQIGKVAQLWRYPVSSIGGEQLEQAELSGTGVGGDRLWCLVGTSSGEVAAPEKRRHWRSSTHLLARNPDRLELRFADGAWLPAFGDEARQRLEAHFGFQVELRRATPAGADPVAPDGVRPRYQHRPIHLLTTASPEALGRLLPDSEIDPRRFRPNLVLQTEGDGFVEQGWLGSELTVGATHLRVVEPCMRCAFTVLAQQGLAQDPAILAQIAAAAEGAFGVLCSVLVPGTVRLGDGAAA
jgi:uncharacterized protein YcbX